MTIKELREAVEAGGAYRVLFSAFAYGWNAPQFLAAYQGSRDAAVAFVKAVLPGWHWAADSEHEGTVFRLAQNNAGVWFVAEEFSATDNASAARALIIATLKALEEQE